MAITTKSALAAELGITTSRVSQYVNRGMPVRSDGKLNREQALRWLSEFTVGIVGKDKGANRAQDIVKRERQAKATQPAAAPAPALLAEPTDIEIGLRVGAIQMLKPHM